MRPFWKGFFANEKSTPVSRAEFAQNIESLLKINADFLMFTPVFTAVPG